MGRPMTTALRVMMLVLTGLFWVAARAEAGALRYTAVDLGTLPGDTQSRPELLNNLGQVIGTSRGSNGDTPFLYSGGQMTPIASNSTINDVGQITHLTHGGPDGFNAYSINNSGLAVGRVGNNLAEAATMQGGVVTPLGTLEPGGWSVAYGVGNSGLIVGSASVGGMEHPVMFKDGQIVDLGQLPGTNAGMASAVNASGQVIGHSIGTVDHAPHGFLYSDGRLTELGSLGGVGASLPNGINAAGQIVGWSTSNSGVDHAFLYQGGQMLDLNNLVASTGGLTLAAAEGINNLGQIAVQATDSDGRSHSLLLTPLTVPEPTSLALAGIIITIMSCRRRQRRR